MKFFLFVFEVNKWKERISVPIFIFYFNFHKHISSTKNTNLCDSYFLFFFSVFIITKVSGKLIRKCALGTELVDWLLNLTAIVHTRAQTAGMWQALLEEGVLSHGTDDKIKFVRFWL